MSPPPPAFAVEKVENSISKERGYIIKYTEDFASKRDDAGNMIVELMDPNFVKAVYDTHMVKRKGEPLISQVPLWVVKPPENLDITGSMRASADLAARMMTSKDPAEIFKSINKIKDAAEANGLMHMIAIHMFNPADYNYREPDLWANPKPLMNEYWKKLFDTIKGNDDAPVIEYLGAKYDLKGLGTTREQLKNDLEAVYPRLQPCPFVVRDVPPV